MRSRAGLVVAVVVVVSLFAARARAQDDTMYTCKVPAAGVKLSASFAPGTSVRDLAVWVSGFTCKNVVIGAELARCAARVDVISPTPMTPKQAVALFVDALDAVGLVVTVKADTIVVKPGPDAWRECSAASSSSSTLPTPAPPDPSAPPPSDDDFSAWIKLIDAEHATIRRALVERLRADPSPILKSARVVPYVKDGKPDGLKLYAIRPSSIFALAGFANGDRVVAIDNVPTPDAAPVEAALEKAAKRDAVTFGLVRRGNPMTLTITVVP